MVAGRHDRTADGQGLAVLNRALLLLAVLLAVLAWPAQAAPDFPKLTGRVTDAAGILPADTVAALDAKLAALEAATTTQLVVATVPDLQGLEIDEYGYQLGRAWGIGQKGTNNGVLLIVAPNERKVRIEVGYGQEGTLTDALTSQIIRRDIIPYFKAGNMAGGVTAGTEALLRYLELPADQQAQAVAQAAAERPAASRSGNGLGTILWLIIIVIWLIVSVSRRRRGLSSGPVILWGPGMGGWGGGGGFGGGGGSFGGGGSSGGW